MKKRFAFDLGTGSLGWAVFHVDDDGRSPKELVDLGVRIFPTGRDPKSYQSNATGRRLPRQQRRQNDRRKKRRAELESKLVKAGLMPPPEDTEARREFFSIDPYEARDRCARGETNISDLGRAIWHMSKHRGFKSNRKTELKDDEDTKKIAAASAKLEDALEGRTYGSWLAERHAKDEGVRVRPISIDAQLSYDFYPTRAMLEEEFDQIWHLQAPHHPSLTSEVHETIRDSVFFQRPLKPVEPGRCTIFPEDEQRLPKWHPMAQEFLILQDLNNLRIISGLEQRPLELPERDLIAKHLLSGKNLTWPQFKKKLKLPRDTSINLEGKGTKKLPYNIIAERLAIGTQKYPAPLGNIWHDLGERHQLLMLDILADTADPVHTRERLQAEIGLTPDVAAKVEKITLPPGRLRFGLRATNALVKVMRDEVVVYSDAIEIASKCGLFGDGVVLNHSDFRPEGDPGLPHLPRYYELESLRRMIGTGTGKPEDPPEVRFGKIANPTVHIALGQFRRVMNALIDNYGKPDQVVIETTRHMAKSTRELNEIEKEIRKNTKRNKDWRKELEDSGILAPGARERDHLLRMRLWEELGKSPADRCCPYSGKPISLTELHSHAVEIDHILPREDTLDDSPTNKTVCFRAENQFKGKRAPGDAWSGKELEAIINRVKCAPEDVQKRKLWRFLPGALEKWEADKSFEDRQLHATGYLARVVRAYAEVLFPKDGTSNIWMPTGRMTGLMRDRWGLHMSGHKGKNRNDHRHHAIDAAVVGVIDRGSVQRLQRLARQTGAEDMNRFLPHIPQPYSEYRNQVLERVAKINVSHRPDHALSGRLHEETAYGLVRDLPENQEDRSIGNLVVRKPVRDLTPTEIGQIRDQKLREELLVATEEVRGNEKKLAEALKSWSERTGHLRVRILKPDASATEVQNKETRASKWLIPGEIAYLNVLEDPEGNWFHHATNIWVAQHAGTEDWRKEYPDAKFVMRFFKNDTLQLFDLDRNGLPIEGTNRIKKVVRLSPSNSVLYLVNLHEAGEYQKRHKNQDDEFRWEYANIGKLKARRARRVRIDELGRVRTVPHGVV